MNPKYMGSCQQCNSLPLGVGGDIDGKRGVPYAEENTVGADLCGDTGVIGLWGPCSMCVFNVRVVDTDKVSYHGIHWKNILSHHKQRKR